MRAKSSVVAVLVSLVFVVATRADFTLTDKNNANGVTIPTGNTASSTYILETDTTNHSTDPTVQTPGPTAGFRFDSTDSTPSTLLTTPLAGADLRQGTNALPQPAQNLAGNENNGYVGTVVGKAWGNAVTLSFNGINLANGPGADLYITTKNLSSNVAQTTSTTNKTMDVGFHVINGTNPGWHLYSAEALPTNYQPAQGAGNVLGALDLSDLKFSTTAGSFSGATLTGLGTFMPASTLIDKIILVNSNDANDWAFGFLGNTSEAPTGFVARRDFDNSDADNNAFTGLDYLTGRYGARDTNGQDGPQAWFVGLTNVQVQAVPEPAAILFGGLVCAGIGIGFGGKKLARRFGFESKKRHRS